MKTLFIDCSMGAAGDMLTAALIDLFEDKTDALAILDALDIPGIKYDLSVAERCGIKGSLISVKVNGVEEGEGDSHEHHHHEHEHHHEHDHEHHHASLKDIEDIVSALPVKEKIKKDVLSVYGLIAEAESRAHGKKVEEIHFHEVGAMDAVADITAVSALIDRLSVERIVVSPIRTGFGSVKCAHGILPVPAPATADIIKGLPVYAGDIEGELLTPTGAALLKHFADEFSEMPMMITRSIGVGMGKKEFAKANCVRAFLGESEDVLSETIKEISFNVDDMTAEEIAFAVGKIFEAGAKDVFTMPAYMKKGRLGTLFTVLCDDGELQSILRVIYKHTSTIGVRVSEKGRYILDRKEIAIKTSGGEVGKKISTGFGVKKEKYGYDDVSRIANEKDLSYKEALCLIENEAKS